METEKMIYLVLEYASGGEIFGNYPCFQYKIKLHMCVPFGDM